MAITLNTNNFNNNHTNSYLNAQKRQQIPTFTANPLQGLAGAVPKKSGFFKPLTDKYDKGIDYVAKYFTAPIVDSKPINALAENFKNSRYLFNHLLAVGSAITSGMYMYKTLTNDKLDKDRKQTLAINQFLTFAFSTAGAYLIDSKIGGWWDKQTAKFAGLRINDDKLANDFVAKNKSIAQNNKKIIEENKGKMSKKDLKLLLDDTDIVKEFVKTRKNFQSMLPKQQRILLNQIEGMSILKTMVVFGAVYRYLVPVLVTPIANKIGDKYLSHKKQQEEMKSNKQVA